MGHGRWKCLQPTSLELRSASLSLFSHRKLHDNILNRCINTYLHTERYAGSELRRLGRMLLYNGLNIGNAPSRYDNKEIRETKSSSISFVFYINYISNSSSNTGLQNLKRK